jgi:AcrR family transcriptional regulator
MLNSGTKEVQMATKTLSAGRATQAERNAISKDKVIRAAIDCLATVGYAATGTSLIASTAGISVGRMQHQFATKAEIMAAVIDFINQQNNRFLSLRKLKATEPIARVVEYVQLLRRTFETDTVAAAIELRMAIKGDKELAAAIGPKFQQYDTRSFADLEELLVAAEMDRTAAHVWMRLIISTIRGMAVERVAHYRIMDRVDAEEALDILTQLLLKAKA